MERVLELIDYRPTSRRGHQLRGACPFHPPDRPRSRCFSVELKRGIFRCFTCGAQGNQLDQWRDCDACPCTRQLSTFATTQESAFRQSTLIPRPDSWLTLARESGSLQGRDRHEVPVGGGEDAIMGGHCGRIALPSRSVSFRFFSSQ